MNQQLLDEIERAMNWVDNMREDVLKGELDPQQYVDELEAALKNKVFCDDVCGIIEASLEEMKKPYDETIYKINKNHWMLITQLWLDELPYEYYEGEITASSWEAKLEKALENEAYPEIRDVIQEAIDNTANIFTLVRLNAEWADMPSDDSGVSAEEIIRSLYDYDISFFPVRPGYYLAKKISGTRYEVRSSFSFEGKSLESILEDTIVGRAMDSKTALVRVQTFERPDSGAG